MRAPRDSANLFGQRGRLTRGAGLPPRQCEPPAPSVTNKAREANTAFEGPQMR
jgi:hypothetical protein